MRLPPPSMFRLSILRITSFFSLLVAAAVVAYAGGTPEDPIEEARTLVSEQRYDDAIGLLTVALRDNPEYFDAAVNVFEDINQVRDAFAGVLEELLDTIEENPEDTARALELLEQLEEIDPFPSRGSSGVLAETRFAIQLTAARNEARRIVEDTREFIRQERYQAAINRYLDGFDLLLTNLREADYYDISGIGTNAESLREAIAQAAQSAGALLNPLAQNSLETLAFLREGNAQASYSAFLDLKQEYLALLEIERTIESALADLKEVNALVEAASAGAFDRDWHIEFVVSFVEGGGAGGILPVVRLAGTEALTPIVPAVADAGAGFYESAEAAFEQGNYEEAVLSLGGLEQYGNLAAESAALEEGVDLAGDGPIAEVMAAVPGRLAELVFRLRTAGRLTPYIDRVGEVRDAFETLPATEEASETELLAARTAVQEIREVRENLESDYDTELASLSELVTDDAAQLSPIIAELETAIEVDEGRFFSREVEISVRTARLQVTDLQDRAEDLAGEVETAESRVARGLDTTAGPSTTEATTSRRELVSVDLAVPVLYDDLELFIERYESEIDAVRTNETVVEAREEAEVLQVTIEELQGRAVGVIAQIDLAPLVRRNQEILDDLERSSDFVSFDPQNESPPSASRLNTAESLASNALEELPRVVEDLQDFETEYAAESARLEYNNRINETRSRASDIADSLELTQGRLVGTLAEVEAERIRRTIVDAEKDREDAQNDLEATVASGSPSSTVLSRTEGEFEQIAELVPEIRTSVTQFRDRFATRRNEPADTTEVRAPVDAQLARATEFLERAAALDRLAAGGLAQISSERIAIDIRAAEENVDDAQDELDAAVAAGSPGNAVFSRTEAVFEDVQAEVPAIRGRVAEFTNRFQTRRDDLVGAGATPTLLNRQLARAGGFLRRATELEQLAAGGLAQVAAERLAVEIGDAEQEFAAEQAELAAAAAEGPVAATLVDARLDALAQLDRRVPELVSDVEEFESAFLGIAEDLGDPTPVEEQLARADNYIARLDDLESNIGAAAAFARAEDLRRRVVAIEDRNREIDEDIADEFQGDDLVPEAFFAQTKSAAETVSESVAAIRGGINTFVDELRGDAATRPDGSGILDQVARASELRARLNQVEGSVYGLLAAIDLERIVNRRRNHETELARASEQVNEGLESDSGPTNAAMNRARNILEPLNPEIEESLTQLDGFFEQYEDLADGLGLSAPVNTQLAEARTVEDRIQAVHGLVVATLGEIDLVPLERRYAGQVEETDRGQNLLDGVEVAGRDNPARYPGRALEVLEEVDDELPGLIRDLGAFIADYDGRVAYIDESPAIRNVVSDGQDLLGATEQLDNRVATLINEAEGNIRLAEELRDDYGRLLAEAENLIRQAERETVSQAQDRFDEATGAAVESLSLAYDPDFEEEVNGAQIAIFNLIRDANREIVRTEVLQNVTQAAELYDDEEYARAFDIIANAEELWVTQFPDTELASLVVLRRQLLAQLQLDSERELIPTDPLYENLVGFLNDARLSFEQGQELMNEGKLTEGRRYIEEAGDAVQNVVAVKPSNWDAKLLGLEIAQVLDRDNFQDLFERRYESAIEDLSDENYVEVLTELEALLQIDPDYPGLEGQIREIKIEYGLIELPRTEEEVDRTAELINQARNLAAGGTEAQLRQATNLLNQVLQIEPGNRTANELITQTTARLDQLTPQTAPLSVSDQQSLNRAFDLFNQGLPVQAYQIVQDLWENELYRGDQALRNLRNRLLSRLGV